MILIIIYMKKEKLYKQLPLNNVIYKFQLLYIIPTRRYPHQMETEGQAGSQP